MIKVCDAIMGSGKSSAAIGYMNSHPENKYIYITPYLEEAERIKNSCPELKFKEPKNNLPEYGFRKYAHTLELVKNGENITSTHNMFLRYSEDILHYIKEWGYVLIVDEAVDILRLSDIEYHDVKLMRDAGWITEEDGVMDINPTFEYNNGRFKDIVSTANSNKLINMTDGDGKHYCYWMMTEDVIKAFSEVYILTYLFEAQIMKYYFDITKTEYTYIGIIKDGNGYNFCDHPLYIPEYTANLSSKIHILENAKLNAIGNNKNALSSTWFKKSGSAAAEKKKQLKNNVKNFFCNYHKDKLSAVRMWATYKVAEGAIRDKGYYYQNIAFNAKATNDYKDRQVLAYCVNVYLHPSEKNYLINHGAEVLEDRYALSVMIQWIWRSAIRDGKEIWIYIPSKRMRTLLYNWISEVEEKYKQMNEVKNEIE